MSDNHEGSIRSPASEDRVASDVQTTSGITCTGEPFARQFDEIEWLLNLHRRASNTGGLHGHSPAPDREGEEDNAGIKERSDDAVTDPKRDSEQPCNEMHPIDRKSLFDSAAMSRGMEMIDKALERNRQKSSLLIGRTEDRRLNDDNTGRDLNAKSKNSREKIEALRQATQVFKARWNEAMERVTRIKEEMEKAAADVGDDELHGEAESEDEEAEYAVV